MKSIVLITTGQPSTNPRLVKEAISLRSAGFEITVIYSFWADWAEVADKKILSECPSIKWVKVGGSKHKNYSLFLLTKVIQKCANYLSFYFKSNIFLHSQTQFRSFLPALQVAINQKADLYIAHNIGALPVAAIAAKKNKSKYGIDFEDYYSGESDDMQYLFRVNFLEQQFFKNVCYSTAASELISYEYTSKYNNIYPIVINNTFPKYYATKAIRDYKMGASLKLFWFSQTVGINRGLQDVLSALNLINDGVVELTILGSVTQEIKLKLSSLLHLKKHQIIWLENVQEAQLFKICQQSDIGLALEPGFSINNNIALSNKIFTYLLSGVAIVLSNTKAQEQFFDANKHIGFKYEIGNFEQLADLLNEYIRNPDLLMFHKQNALQLGLKKYHWENDRDSFCDLIMKIVNQ